MENQPTFESLSDAETEALTSLRGLLAGDARPRLVLSDFDYTLCEDYTYDHQTNNHHPLVRPEVIAAVRDTHLLIATGRRGNHPHLPLMWESGLVSVEVPIIAENGGTLAFSGGSHIDLISALEAERLKQDTHVAISQLGPVPDDQILVVKEGRTCMVVRLEDQEGIVSPDAQTWLSSSLRPLITGSGLQIVDSRVSLVVQMERINKAAAFNSYLKLIGLNREDYCVVGMGDAENDNELFVEADISIGYSQDVARLVDVTVPAGVANAAAVLRCIQGQRATN